MSDEHVEHLIADVVRLEAENARLQEQVEEAERQLSEHGCRKVEREAFRERDGYKALAKRRGEALAQLLPEYKTWVKSLRESSGWPDGGPYWQEAEAALAAAPELT